MHAASSGAHPIAFVFTYTTSFVFTHACSISEPDALPDAVANAVAVVFTFTTTKSIADSKPEPCSDARTDPAPNA